MSFSGRQCASLTQSQIVLGGSALVAMSLDGNDPRRIPTQHVHVLVENHPTFGVDLRAVVAKKHRPERRFSIELLKIARREVVVRVD